MYGWIIKYRDKRKIFRELEGIYWMSKDNFKMWVFNLFLKSVIWKQSVNWKLKMCLTKHKPHAGHNVDHTLPALSVHSHYPRQRRNGPVCWCTTLCYFQWARYSAFFLGDLDLWPLTLTFKLIRARDQTRLLCEFGANPFAVPEIFHTKTKSHSAKNRTLRSSLRAVISG